MDYFSHCDTEGKHDLWEGETEVFRKGYLTDQITEEAISFVERRREGPFMLSVHDNAPHWPWLTREDSR